MQNTSSIAYFVVPAFRSDGTEAILYSALVPSPDTQASQSKVFSAALLLSLARSLERMYSSGLMYNITSHGTLSVTIGCLPPAYSNICLRFCIFCCYFRGSTDKQWLSRDLVVLFATDEQAYKHWLTLYRTGQLKQHVGMVHSAMHVDASGVTETSVTLHVGACACACVYVGSHVRCDHSGSC